MRRFLVRIIPIVTLSLFLAVMLSASYMKKPRNQEENVDKFISTTIEYVKNEEWGNAEKEIEKLDLAWNKILKRVQFSSELDQINYLSESINKAKGGIIAEDKGISLSNLISFYEEWKIIGK
ncbi:DUF4363 family protein [Clostridium botulinum]|uniref:DUF4363 family protein n=1 Tax=Clostridium botulinum TaxID=1491 RepID=A0A846J8X9_CLOBO|nr:DUF4363 family protein [Clostridium botulinum]ACA55720.1 conserved hypothetical protein [Clostridium botulinum A3 str. Loch Maree]NFH66574.1 DUF4363 family protein [Clostridium botulinum]NFJ10329.1 DUF4363 family protein [Clostridium botulinum]NFK15703.1 DUF4363 family protein [Clostridium botulinum]NFM95810.1 DUF4363 family protein [Clostridium botulinum]